jgi:hypothetical protein
MSFGPKDDLLGKIPCSPTSPPQTDLKKSRELPKINPHQVLPPPRQSSQHSQILAPIQHALKPYTAATNYSFVSADDINPGTKVVMQNAIQSFSQKVAQSGIRFAQAQNPQHMQAQPRSRKQMFV